MSQLLEETSVEEAVYKTRRMHKEVRKFRTTEPFHSGRKCDDHRCVWHRRQK